MGLFSKAFKGNFVLDADAKPTGVAGVEAATMFDGVAHSVTGLLDDTKFVTGTAATISALSRIALTAVATSLYTTNEYIPRRRA